MTDVSTIALPTGPAPQMPRTNGSAKATAEAFESVFVGQMTKIMMETVPTDGPFSGGHGEEMFRGILAEKMGDAIARRGGIGIAPAVLQQMIKMQGGKE